MLRHPGVRPIFLQIKGAEVKAHLTGVRLRPDSMNVIVAYLDGICMREEEFHVMYFHVL